MAKVTRASFSKGTFNLFVGNLVSTILLAVAAIIVGRLLGPDGYGLYTIALIVPTYAYLLLGWGLSWTITRFTAKYISEGNERKAVSFGYTISILHLLSGLLVIGLLIPFSNTISTDLLHRPELATGIIVPIALLSVVGQILFYDSNAAFVGLHAFRKSAIFLVINAAAKLAVSIILVLIGYSVLGAVAGYSGGFLVAGVISIAFLVLMNKSLIPTNIRGSINTIASYAPPIYFSNVLTTIVMPFQNTILAFAVSNSDIGWYSAAVNIAALTALLTYPVSNILLPMFSEALGGGIGGLADAYRISVKYTALFVTPVSTLIMALSNPLSIAIYGQAYRFTSNYLVILVAVSLLAGIGNISWIPFLEGVGKTREILVAAAIGSVFSIMVSILLVSSIGVYGVIIGTLIGQIASLFVGSRFVSNILKVRLQVWFVWRIYLSCALSAALVYTLSLLGLNSYFVVLAGVALYLLVFFPIATLTKALTRQDVEGLQAQFKETRFMSYALHLIDKYQSIFRRKSDV